MPEGPTSIKIKSFLKDDLNSQTLSLYDLGLRSPRTDNIIEIFDAIISEPFFDIIRTKEQLAYSLSSSTDLKEHAGYLKFSVRNQEDKFSSKIISDRLKKFIAEDIKEILENLTDEKFEKIKEGKIREELEPFNSISSEANYNMRRIVEESFIFDLFKKDAKIIETITKQEILDFYTKVFVTNKHKNLTVQIVGNGEGEENEEMEMKFLTEKYCEDEVVVSDLDAFRDGLEKYPKYVRNYE
jgi:secreted Zn-dependent insulinase-like peptidase